MSKEEIKSLLSLANSGNLAKLTVKLADYLAQSPDARVQDIVHHKSGDGLVHILARCGHQDCLTFLLTNTRVFVDQRNLEDKTALHEAAQFGQEKAVEILLQQGAQVNSLKRADWTPLMLATTKVNNVASVNLLLSAGAQISLVNKDGWTSFHLAVRTGDLSLLSCLLQTDPQCWKTVSKNGRTPLHTACLAGLVHVVRLLLQLDTGGGLHVHSADSCGSTPLMDAARGDHLACIQSLLARQGVDLSAEDRMGRRVVQVAAQAGAVTVLEYLKDECGVVVGEGGTMHCAAREGQTDVVQRLISWGVEVDKRDNEGRTPLFLSVSGQHAETSRVLLEAGASPDSQDSRGVVVRSLARRQQIVDIVSQFV
eukprot:GFUD01016296.1.p1 GENE.GFUD01016296.1~~GFUD01016296.1.p1  ORF type:complete len:368 (+),score=151.48 GFUD01016296.1:51-1154(+)